MKKVGTIIKTIVFVAVLAIIAFSLISDIVSEANGDPIRNSDKEDNIPILIAIISTDIWILKFLYLLVAVCALVILCICFQLPAEFICVLCYSLFCLLTRRKEKENFEVNQTVKKIVSLVLAVFITSFYV